MNKLTIQAKEELESDMFRRIKEACELSGMGYIAKGNHINWGIHNLDTLDRLIKKGYLWISAGDMPTKPNTLPTVKSTWIILKKWEYIG